MRQIIIELIALYNGEYLLIDLSSGKPELPHDELQPHKTGKETIEDLLTMILNANTDDLEEKGQIIKNHTLHPIHVTIKKHQPIEIHYGILLEGNIEEIELHTNYKLIHLSHLKDIEDDTISAKVRNYINTVNRE